MRRHLARWYGAGPLHLVGLVVSFVVAGYAADRLLQTETVRYIVWIVGAAVVHDLVLLPVYSLVDRAARAGSARARVPWINHLRLPAFLSGLLFLVFLPLIGSFPAGFESTTGFSTDPYLGRWLAITAVLFAASAVAYAARLLRGPRSSRGAG